MIQFDSFQNPAKSIYHQRITYTKKSMNAIKTKTNNVAVVQTASLLETHKAVPNSHNNSFNTSHTHTLLLDRRSIDLNGAQEKEGHFNYKNYS